MTSPPERAPVPDHLATPAGDPVAVLPLSRRRLDLALVLMTVAFFIPLPFIELWFAIGWEPSWATPLIDGYAALGDPLVAARTFYGRFVFVLHTFVYQPIHVALLVGLIRGRRWTRDLALVYVASGLTTDGFWYWFELTGVLRPTQPFVVFGLLAPYTLYKLLLAYRFCAGRAPRPAEK